MAVLTHFMTYVILYGSVLCGTAVFHVIYLKLENECQNDMAKE